MWLEMGHEALDDAASDQNTRRSLQNVNCLLTLRQLNITLPKDGDDTEANTEYFSRRSLLLEN